jgi:hypothetical protein
MNTCIEYVQPIVASLKDGETGEPIHPASGIRQ